MGSWFELADMTRVNPLLHDLDDAVSRGTPESRARALWQATDLMTAGRFSEDEIWTFGEVIGRLADEIEVTARAQVARRLARFNDVSVNILHKLAFDDSIDVAAPWKGLEKSFAVSTSRRLAASCNPVSLARIPRMPLRPRSCSPR